MKINNTAPIVEIFSSIQGEGQSLGIPSIFVRFFGCNLRCTFKGSNCDTPYAVLKRKNGQVKNFTVEELYKKVDKFKQHRIIFTGGEPMLFQSFISDFIIYCDEQRKDHFIYEVETNGTIAIETSLQKKIDLFNLSVKLKSSNQANKMYEEKRINYNVLKTFPGSKTSYKFVISNPKQDEKEIDEIFNNILPNSVYLMPEGCTRKEVLSNSPKVVEMCIRNDFHFSPREHINIWNMKKGV